MPIITPPLLQQEPWHFPTGARPSPPHVLAAATPFRAPRGPAPAQVAYVPARLDPWGNDTYGDCVSAEEAFSKACFGLDGQGGGKQNEIFIDPSVVISWARAHGVLNGAGLTEVMDSMQNDGYVVAAQRYNDGPYAAVNWSDEAALQAAIAQGPIKIACAASVLPSGAGSVQGWYVVGNHGGINRVDHCIPIAGYGPAQFLFDQLEVPLPSALSPNQPLYLLATWGTMGVADHAWIMGNVPEAWLRTPTTVGVPPLAPLPSPDPNPNPFPAPAPAPTGTLSLSLNGTVQSDGTVSITGVAR